MLTKEYYEKALLKRPITEPGAPSTSPNYKKTDDPNVVIGKHGVKITKADMDKANKSGMAWMSFDSYADWYGGWAKKVPDQNTHPYYRTYPSGKIDAGDMELLMAKDDPAINDILKRNLVGAGEVPLFGENDSDMLRVKLNELKKQGNEGYLKQPLK